MHKGDSKYISGILSEALAQSATGVLLSDSSGSRIIFMNRAAEKILNITKKRLINRALDTIIKENICYVDKTPYTVENLPIVRAVRNIETVISEEVLIRLPNSKERWIMVNASPVIDSKENIIAGMSTFTDITAVKQLDLKNKEFGIKFQQAKNMESISSLASGIAHEVNNALFEITGSMELLEMKVNDKELLDNYPKKISNAIKRITTLTKQLLAYSRGGKYRISETSVNEIVEAVLPRFHNPSECSEIKVISELLSTEMIEVDFTQFEMVLSAILTNAFESIFVNGEVKIHTFDLAEDSSFVKNHPGLSKRLYSCLKIADNGKGMIPKTINNIFKPFFTTNFTGRGLGMAAVYGIVKNHNGWIDIDSKPDIGTTVSIFLPSKREKSKGDKINIDGITTGNLILLVEDESSLLSINREMIEYIGFKTIEAKSGKEALRIISQRDIDIAIIDVDLPDMKCKELLRAINKKWPDMTIYISSTYPAEEVKNEIDIRSSQILQKPFTLTTLIIKLSQYLEQSEPESFSD